MNSISGVCGISGVHSSSSGVKVEVCDGSDDGTDSKKKNGHRGKGVGIGGGGGSTASGDGINVVKTKRKSLTTNSLVNINHSKFNTSINNISNNSNSNNNKSKLNIHNNEVHSNSKKWREREREREGHDDDDDDDDNKDKELSLPGSIGYAGGYNNNNAGASWWRRGFIRGCNIDKWVLLKIFRRCKLFAYRVQYFVCPSSWVGGIRSKTRHSPSPTSSSSSSSMSSSSSSSSSSSIMSMSMGHFYTHFCWPCQNNNHSNGIINNNNTNNNSNNNSDCPDCPSSLSLVAGTLTASESTSPHYRHSWCHSLLAIILRMYRYLRYCVDVTSRHIVSLGHQGARVVSTSCPSLCRVMTSVVSSLSLYRSATISYSGFITGKDSWVTGNHTSNSENEDEKQIRVLEREIKSLEKFVEELFLELVCLRESKQRLDFSVTFWGKIFRLSGYILTLVGVMKLIGGMWRVGMFFVGGRFESVSQQADNVTSVLSFVLVHLRYKLDVGVWTPILGALNISSMALLHIRAFIVGMTQFANMGVLNTSTEIYSLVLAYLVGAYSVSGVVFLRTQLPLWRRRGVTIALGEGMILDFYFWLFDVVFIVSTLVSCGYFIAEYDRKKRINKAANANLSSKLRSDKRSFL